MQTKSEMITLHHVFCDKPLRTTCFFRERLLQGREALLPLYLYPEEADLDQTRRVNMDPTIRAAIEKAATLSGGDAPDEVAIFDYIYGVLHCPAYRATYAEFLKIDFPRIPYPASPEAFADISAKGTACAVASDGRCGHRRDALSVRRHSSGRGGQRGRQAAFHRDR